MTTARPVTYWSRCALLKIEKQKVGSEDVVSSTVSGVVPRNTLDLKLGKRDVEFEPTLSCGRVYKEIPDDTTEINFDLFLRDTALARGNLDTFFYGNTEAGSDPRSYTAENTRDMFRLVVLFTNDTTVSDPSGAIGATLTGVSARRWIFADAHFTDYAPSFTDGILKASCGFKVPYSDETGARNIKYESTWNTTNSNGQLAALGQYTTSNKF
jgi:hypothetical protein